MFTKHRSNKILFLLFLFSSPMVFSQEMWINEFHYDDAGGDANEFIEVVIQDTFAGNLSDLSITLYNGNGGVAYGTHTLDTFVMGTPSNGFNFYSKAIPGIQNGAPDGFAFYNDVTLVEFLSYEGSFTATNGIANGETSVDVGVLEPGSGSDTDSLQLIGTGTMASDFTWTGPIGNTQGAINTGQSFGAGGGFSIISTIPVDLATDVAINTTITIVGSEPADWTANAVTIDCGAGNLPFAGLSANGTDTVVLTPTSDLPGGETCTVTVVMAEISPSAPLRGRVSDNFIFTFDTILPFVCADPVTAINQVQGAGNASPMAGQVVDIEAIVVGDFQDDTALDAFYLQEADADADADPLTSEGVFVDDTGNAVAVALGDRVRVRGTVAEQFGNTIISNAQVMLCSSGNAAPTTAQITLPLNGFDLETIEGMSVELAQLGTVTNIGNYVRFGEFVVSNGRLMQATAIATPGAAANAQQLINDDNQLIVDDGRDGSNQTPFSVGQDDATPIDALNPVRAGFVVNPVGVLHFSFGNYKIQPTQGLVFDESANPRTNIPADPGSNFKVATFNLRNLFSTIDTGASICGPNNLSCRGADSATELTRQLDKLVMAINASGVSVVGLQEIENNSTASLDLLVNALNTAAGAGTWNSINTGTIGTDAIKNAIIYQPDLVVPVGPFAILDSSVDPNFDDFGNRPVVVQTFSNTQLGALNVAVAHLRSKSCSGATGLNQDQGDGQGCYNESRRLAAVAIATWLATDPTGEGVNATVILADLNSYQLEDPLTALSNGGYTDVITSLQGTTNWTTSFGGEFGSLDYVLANADAMTALTGGSQWHHNADEYFGFDYNEENLPGGLSRPADFYQGDVFRSSDHDIVIAGFDLNGSVTFDFLTPTSMFAESVGTVMITAGIDRTIPFDTALNVAITTTGLNPAANITTSLMPLLIPAGSTTVDISIDIIEDNISSGNNVVMFTPTPVTPVVFGPGAGLHEMTLIDNDTAGITVNPVAGLVTSEAGINDVFDVVLNSEPTANVSIDVSSNDPTEGSAATGTLVFTPANWSTPQTVTIIGLDDALVDGSIDYMIITDPAVSADVAYSGMNPADVAVTNLDDEAVTTSFTGPTATGTGLATLTISGGGPLCSLTSAAFVDVGTVADPAPNFYLFKHGLATFQADGCDVGVTLTVTMDYPSEIGPREAIFKYGPNPVLDEWYVYPGTTTFDSITIQVTDGGQGDADGMTDGSITDPFGPASFDPPVIPSTNTWALVSLGFGVLFATWFMARRRVQL
ncbi:MAG: ExeM/NucH family extracellular endonuclease [Proteobacteria bacterium]|nr:ExeM/NucH family extracellular endonuclease [Pseudomonadota bacterium]